MNAPAPKTTMAVADAHGRARPSQRALDAANEIADQFVGGFVADSMVLDIADIIDRTYNPSMQRVTRLLRSVEKIAGNLPDDRLDTRTGPNDACMRGLWVIGARQLAQEALTELGEETEDFNGREG